jgi:hypothetical protein
VLYGQTDISLARYDAAGGVVWAKTLGGASYDIADGLATLPDGGVVVGGRFSGPASFGGPTMATPTPQDALLVAYGPDGAWRWQRQGNVRPAYTGATADALVTGLAANATRIAATGYYRGIADLGGGPMTSPFGTDLDLWVGVYDLAGVPVWVKNFQNDGTDRGYDVAIDSSGAVAVVGSFTNSLNLGGATLLSLNAMTDAFVAVLEPNGAHRWSRQVGAPDGSEGLESVAFAGADVVACGNVVKAIDVGTGILPALGGADGLVILYGPAGAPVWARRIGGLGNDYVKSCAYDATTGEVRVTGSFERTASFGGVALDAAGNGDVFVARYAAATGVLVDVQRLGGVDAEQAYEVTPSGIVGGYFYGTPAFPGGALNSKGAADGFVARP